MNRRITSHHWTTWRPTHWSRFDGELYQRVRGGYVDEDTWRNGGRQVLDSEAERLELEPVTDWPGR